MAVRRCVWRCSVPGTKQGKEPSLANRERDYDDASKVLSQWEHINSGTKGVNLCRRRWGGQR